jgi:hypothetical protein
LVLTAASHSPLPCRYWSQYAGVANSSGHSLTQAIAPTPHRTTVTWADFLRSQAEAILAMDFIETVTLTGTRQYILAAIHHASRQVRILGATAHPTPIPG